MSKEQRKESDPCPECGRKISLEIQKYGGPNVVWAKRNLPSMPPRCPTVTLPIETLKKWRDDYNLLSEFVAWVCGVDKKTCCLGDMMKATGEWKRIGMQIREANGVDE